MDPKESTGESDGLLRVGHRRVHHEDRKEFYKMNNAILTGNIVREPEYRCTTNGVPICSFTVAVRRPRKDSSGTYPTDFINCVAWRTTAEFVHKHFQKGSPIGVTGEIQTRNFEDAKGIKRYVTEVVVSNVEFIGKKQEAKEEPKKETDADDLFGEELSEFQPLPDVSLPF